MVSLSFRFPIVSAPGFGTTCLNRHDASITNIVISGEQGVNYTSSGSTILANTSKGYTALVYLDINSTVFQNPQPDLTNGSVFAHLDIVNSSGYVLYKGNLCIYNIPLSPMVLVLDQYFFPNAGNGLLMPINVGQQTVTFATGTHKTQYDVSWIA
jgi:hypothetical protein